MIPHAGIIHASGWIIIKKIQVAITQEVSTIRNNLIFANNGLGAVVFIFIVMFSLLFMQDSDFGVSPKTLWICYVNTRK